MRRLAEDGYDLVIGVGFIFSDDIRRLASEFPRVHFACVDYAPPPDGGPGPANLVGLRFREEEGSFLVGAAAGLVSTSKRVGFVGGMKIPLIRKFEAGYQAGVAQTACCRLRRHRAEGVRRPDARPRARRLASTGAAPT
jgi:basic membrane protein A